MMLYVASFFWGVVQVMRPDSGRLYLLFSLVMAGAAACWAVSDARNRGKPILHILQLFIFLLWPIAVPVYLISTRGFRGLGLSVAHAMCLILALCIGFYITVFSIYGFDVYANRP